MRSEVSTREQQRLKLQTLLDDQKTQTERNRLGQFATPTALAEDILRYATNLLPSDAKVHFLDPAIGTGSFFSALLQVLPRTRIVEALGFELDPHYGKPAAKIWADYGLTLQLADFTHSDASSRFNVVICNPPYVRHHHLKSSEKSRLQHRTQIVSGMRLSGLAGLYCYFLGLSHAWMATDSVAGWLIPSEFMDVNYGKAVKQYLLNRVTLLHIHRFDPNDVQFADALVSSAIVWFRNTPPLPDHEVRFTFGGTLLNPRIDRHVSTCALATESKWTRFPLSNVRSHSRIPRLSDFFRIKRGLVTGGNSFFMLTEEEIALRELPIEVFTPILPSPRYLHQNEVKSRNDGSPDIERRLFLLNTNLSENAILSRFPKLFAYLQEGKEKGIHERYICSHRSPWYSQENRPAAPILCTYLGRNDTRSGRPFRFILNGSQATVANVYLSMYPVKNLWKKMERDRMLVRRIWELLNQITPSELLSEGRIYGGGLCKLEPKELARVNAMTLAELFPDIASRSKMNQLGLFGDEYVLHANNTL